MIDLKLGNLVANKDNCVLKILRNNFSESSTKGVLLLEGSVSSFIGRTLERPLSMSRQITVGTFFDEDHCIPFGTYKCIKKKVSKRAAKELGYSAEVELLNVMPLFDGKLFDINVYIHAGNWPYHSTGCILVSPNLRAESEVEKREFAEKLAVTFDGFFLSIINA